MFLFSSVPVFHSCFSVPVYRCSCFPLFLFLCSCFQMFLFSSVLVFHCSCFSVPVFRCSCFSLFLFSSVPVIQCSCSSVFAVRTLRPVGLGCVDGTKTVVSWSYLWEKTGYSLVHSDIQVCTYHTRQD